MNLILNLLWALLGGGILTALEYVLVGLVCCITLIGLPFGLQCFKIAGLALFPFGKLYDEPEMSLSTLTGNLLWILFAGIWIFLSHLALALPLAVSIIGLPFAFQHLKLGMLAFAPFGTRIYDVG